MIKRLLILLVIVALTAAGLFFALNTPVVAQHFISSAIQKNLKGYTLEVFTIGRQQFLDGHRLVWTDVQCRIKSKETFYHIAASKIESQGFKALWDPALALKISAENVALKSPNIEAQPGMLTARFFFKNRKLDRFEGEVTVPHLEAYRYKLDQVSTSIDGTLKTMALRDLKANSYQGRIFGDILLDWQKDLPYSINVHFDSLDLRPMKELSPAIGQVEGIVSGSITIAGNTTNFNTLDLKANVTKEGRVNASLLKFVTPYIPRTQESVALDGMMKRGEKIPIEIAAMELRSIDTHKLSGFVKLYIGTLNLDLNLPIDILYDGNLISLIEWYRKLNP